MKLDILIYMFMAAIVLFSILLVGCDNVDGEPSSTGWGIIVSPGEGAGRAYGYISLQTTESIGTYLIDSAYVRAIGHGMYQLMYKFTSSDSLQVIVVKRTPDFNFHYPKPDTVNQLLYGLFNADSLALDVSSVAIQPVFESQTFHTVTNLRTIDNGKIYGTVDGVPLIK